MKRLPIVVISVVISVVCLMSCAQKSGGKFPRQIGEYTKTGINNMPLCPDMESNTMITYSGSEGWVIVSLTAYKTDEAAKRNYNKAEETGRKECEVTGLSGMCKTGFSYNTVNVSFGWREGKTLKVIAVSKQKQANENINDIEKKCKEKLLLFIDAFKGR